MGLYKGRTAQAPLPSNRLPPRFRLYAIRQAIRSVQIGHSAHIAPECVRPVAISQEGAQYRPAKKLVTSSDLRRDGKFAQPSIQIGGPGLGRNEAFGVVKSSLEC